jgi:hypothetical protein
MFYFSDLSLCLCLYICEFNFVRSLQGNKFVGPIPPVIGLMQALAVL